MKRPAATPARSPQPRAEINVTPLVDVCLVLLIIFMVVTPLPYRQVKEVARTIRDAGFSRLGLITRRDGAETSPMAPGDGA
jgi:biopolymer transport protein ExbD